MRDECNRDEEMFLNNPHQYITSLRLHLNTMVVVVCKREVTPDMSMLYTSTLPELASYYYVKVISTIYNDKWSFSMHNSNYCYSVKKYWTFISPTKYFTLGRVICDKHTHVKLWPIYLSRNSEHTVTQIVE